MEDNVKIFLDKATKIVESAAGEYFENQTITTMEKYNVNSPIEQILYIALMALIRANGIKVASEYTLSTGKDLFSYGIDIYPQFPIGRYRTDFRIVLVDDINVLSGGKKISVVVECDSQQFHDRTETERRYEKKRDRDIQKSGHKTYRFTGSEIVKSPYLIAAEIIKDVTGIKELVVP